MGAIYGVVDISVEVIGALVIAISIVWAIIRYAVSRNPAQAIVSGMTSRSNSMALSKDLAAFLTRGELRFSVHQFRWPESRGQKYRLSRLNYECFLSSFNYSGTFEAKVSRNNSIIEKNLNAFCIIGPRRREVGFTSVLPLLPRPYELYRSGKISDHDIFPEMIAAPGEDVGGIILFAIGLRPKEVRKSKARRGALIRQLLRGLIFHVRSLTSAPGGDQIPLLVQAEKLSIIRGLKNWGFVELPTRGGDGDRLFETTLADLRAKASPG